MTDLKPQAEQPNEENKAGLMSDQEQEAALKPSTESNTGTPEVLMEPSEAQSETGEILESAGQLPVTEKPSPEAETIEEEAVPIEPTPEGKPSRMRQFLVRTLRWVLGIGIVFGLGALLVVFTLYLPARRSLMAIQTDLDRANRQVNSLQADIEEFKDTIAGLQTTNTDLTENADQLKLHALILSARADIAAAQVALIQEEPDRVQVLLAKTPQTLEDLANELPADQSKLVNGLNDRLDQALEALDSQTYASESDLEVIATALLELENAYFSKPTAP